MNALVLSVRVPKDRDRQGRWREQLWEQVVASVLGITPLPRQELESREQRLSAGATVNGLDEFGSKMVGHMPVPKRMERQLLDAPRVP